MARDFDAVDDVITATVGTIGAEDDFTVGAWIYADGWGEGTAGRILQVESGGAFRVALTLTNVSSAATLLALRDHATADAQSQASNGTLALSKWWAVFATYRASDNTIRLYVGDLATPVAETSYSLQTVGTGAAVTGGANAYIGNLSAGNRTFDGKLADVFYVLRELTLADMEAFRLGDRSSILHPNAASGLRGFWPLDSPTASQAEDLSGNGAVGTVTGATVADDPPIPMGLAAVMPVVAPSALAAVETGFRLGVGVDLAAAPATSRTAALELGAGVGPAVASVTERTAGLALGASIAPAIEPITERTSGLALSANAAPAIAPISTRESGARLAAGPTPTIAATSTRDTSAQLGAAALPTVQIATERTADFRLPAPAQLAVALASTRESGARITCGVAIITELGEIAVTPAGARLLHQEQARLEYQEQARLVHQEDARLVYQENR